MTRPTLPPILTQSPFATTRSEFIDMPVTRFFNVSCRDRAIMPVNTAEVVRSGIRSIVAIRCSRYMMVIKYRTRLISVFNSGTTVKRLKKVRGASTISHRTKNITPSADDNAKILSSILSPYPGKTPLLTMKITMKVAATWKKSGTAAQKLNTIGEEEKVGFADDADSGVIIRVRVSRCQRVLADY